MMWNRLLASTGVLLMLGSVVLGQLPPGRDTADTPPEELSEVDVSGRPPVRFTSVFLFQQAPTPIDVPATPEVFPVGVFDQALRLAGVGIDVDGPICWIAAGEGAAVALRVGDRFLEYEVVEIREREAWLRTPDRTEVLRLFAGH